MASSISSLVRIWKILVFNHIGLSLVFRYFLYNNKRYKLLRTAFFFNTRGNLIILHLNNIAWHFTLDYLWKNNNS